MQKSTRVVQSAIKVLEVLATLRGHSLDGLSNDEIAKAVKQSPSAVHRFLETLIATGWATKLENGRFAPAVRANQFALAHLNEVQQAQGRISELTQRVAAGAR